MTITELVDRSYVQARDQGFHSTGETFAGRLALAHSELSEALEAFRETGDIATLAYSADGRGKPLGVPSELADCVIRIADMCGLYGIDLQRAITEKLDYNRSRGWRHGGKQI